MRLQPTWILFGNYEMRAHFGNLQKSRHLRPLTPTRTASQHCIAIWLAGSIIGEWTELRQETKSSPALSTSADQSGPTVAHVSAGPSLCARWQSANTAHDLRRNSWLFFLFPALSSQLFAVHLQHSDSTHVHLFEMLATYPILTSGAVDSVQKPQACINPVRSARMAVRPDSLCARVVCLFVCF